MTYRAIEVTTDHTHERGGWCRIGSVFYGGQVALGCKCGWRSKFTEHHYQADSEFLAHAGLERCCGHSSLEHDPAGRCMGRIETVTGTAAHMRFTEPCYCRGFPGGESHWSAAS